MELRVAEAADHGEIIALFREAFGSAPGREGLAWWVAREDGAVVGLAAAGPLGRDGALRIRAELRSLRRPDVPARDADHEITALAVRRELRRRGIGRALLDHVVRALGAEGTDRLWAHCVVGSGSGALFRAAGFREYGRLVAHYGSRAPIASRHADLLRRSGSDGGAPPP